MADSRDLLSVGMDVGTTTTQIIFSRLNLQDVSRPGQIPRINITDRKVIYQSPIMFTPLKDFETIDADKLNEIVRREYSAANINPKDVETGAVIITGETAKKKNADEILTDSGADGHGYAGRREDLPPPPRVQRLASDHDRERDDIKPERQRRIQLAQCRDIETAEQQNQQTY